MYDVQEYALYEDYGIDLRDVYTPEQIEEIRQIKEEKHSCFSPSMDSLGLSWRDFL